MNKNILLLFYEIYFFIFVFCQMIHADGHAGICVKDGHVIFEAEYGKNISIRLKGNSYFNIDEINVVETLKKFQNPLSTNENRGGSMSTENQLENLRRRVFDGVSSISSRIERVENLTRTDTQRFALRRIRRRLSVLEARVQRILSGLEEDACRSDPCQNGGTCVNIFAGFMCQCPTGWEGKICSNDINECALYSGTDLGCQNDGRCVNTPGSFSCVCKSGWYGSHCMTKKVDCLTSLPSEICGKGICVNANNEIGYTCICDQGWKTNGLTPACTVDVDECTESHPRCASTCHNLPGSFTCGPCPTGFTGNGFFCTDIDECAINNGGCSLSPLVNCINTMGSYMCGSCPPGWTGDGKSCFRSSTCLDNPHYCHPLATCQDVGNIVMCICRPGMTGDGIGVNGCVPIVIDACYSLPCLNGGRCIVNGSSYSCACRSGYSGVNCERTSSSSVCISNPCQNGGTCIPTGNSRYRCNCRPGFSGLQCNMARARCGGVLRNPSGVLKYPPGSDYEHNTRCAWIIRTNTTQVLNITFTKFDLEGSANTVECRYDWLQIHDGPNPASHLIGRFCGNALPKGGNIISTSHDVYLWFRSDNSTAGEGFELQWNSIAPICGGEIVTDSHGVIASPGSPGKYPKNRICTWHMMAPFGKRIRLSFFTMQLENHNSCDYDYVAIYEGSITDGSPIERYCNTSHPPPFTAPGNEITIVFRSDGEGSDLGFQLHYHVIEGVPGCGGEFTQKKGEFGSPINQDGEYPNDMLCEYQIKVPGNSRIEITFTKFDLENSEGCIFDSLAIYDTVRNESFLVGKWCGDVMPLPYKSQSNTLLIKFVSDISGSSRGFYLRYQTICGGIYKAESGVLTSPRYPYPYDNETNCLYEIEAPEGKVIVLEFEFFELEDKYLGECSTDYVQIMMIEGRPGENYCGDKKPPRTISDHNYLAINFITDQTVVAKGFKANYSFVDAQCGGVIRNLGTTIKPPMEHDDLGYKHETDCTWIIVAPRGYSVQLTFLSFHLEESSDCIYDSVTIFNNYTAKYSDEVEEEKLGRFCGTQKPPTIMSTNNILTIKFHSDSTNSGEGFLATYIFIDVSKVCGGTYFASSGTIQSPGWPSPYLPSKECVWVIKAQKGKQIELRFKSFSLENSSACYYDYLEIRNGGDSNSPLYGKFCGDKIVPRIKSFSNQIYIKFNSDSSTAFDGFQLEWDSTSTGCGGTLTTYEGSITSPNYPLPYPHDVQCNWLITISKGSKISIVITDIDFESHYSCEYDFISIYDGDSTMSNRLGTYCSIISNPIVIHTDTSMAFILMETDRSTAGRGFSLSYSTNCKIELTDIHGTIQSPNYPENYPESINCEWRIKAPKGNRIFLEFLHLELEGTILEQNIPCAYDYLKISDIVDNHELNTKRLCNAKPPQYNSTKNEILINFVSDFSQTASGFHLEYKMEGCLEIFTDELREFSSPNYPQFYRNDIECHWQIIAEYGQLIELTIFDYDIEQTKDCTSDGLLIANGKNELHLISKLCGRSSSNRTKFTSNTHEMFIKFYSNDEVQAKGFKASYTVIKSKCGGIMEAVEGYIYSPNYPKNYDLHSHCEWLIRSHEHHTLNLTIEDFDIEDSTNCTNDYMAIYDGAERNENRLLLKTCGNDVPKANILNSSGNEILIVFVSDSTVQYKGFKISYKQNCGQRINTNSTGMISLDTSRQNVKFCIWTIVATDLNQHITFTTTHFEERTPTFQQNQPNEDCLSSGAVFYDGDSTEVPIKKKICSSHPSAITSYGNSLTIKISPDIVSSFEGFYSVFDNACGGRLNSLKGRFSSPLYPDSYPINTQCIWTIEATDGNSIELNIEVMDIEDSDECNKDYLEIRENNSNGKVLGIFCGNNIPTQIKSEKIIWIKFSSDNDIMGKGFYAQYNYARDNELSGNNGTITSPRYPYTTQLFGIYSWRIIAPIGNVIALNLVDLQSNIYHYINLFDGYDTTSLEVSINPENPTIFSRTSAFYITAARGPFMIQWTTTPRNALTKNQTDGPCPQNKVIVLKDISIILNSPGYPYGYSGDLHCSWILKSEDITSHVAIEVMNVDLENDENCGTDYLSISRGNTDMVNWEELDKICKTEPNTISRYEGKYLKIEFHTDYTVNKTGFSTIIKTVCGSALREPFGIINGTYVDKIISRNVQACTWNITVRPGRKIKFEFVEMNINKVNYKCESYVMIRNGIDEESPVLGDGKYCGTINNNIPLTLYNRATVQYVKEGIFTKNSWILKFTEVREDCLSELRILDEDHPSTSITNPNYPSASNPFTECEWVVRGPAGKRFHIEFDKRFDLKYSDGCDKEYVEVRNGGTKYAKLIDRFCGSTPNPFYSTSNIIQIKYVTDISSPRTGFNMTVSLSKCGGTFYQANGIIESINYPNPSHFQDNDMVCEYYIERPDGTQINLIFIDLKMNCDYEGDSISVYSIYNQNGDDYEGSKKELDSTCGENLELPFNLTVSSNTASIIYKPAKQINAIRGIFKISYTSLVRQCGGTIEAESGIIKSPDYPYTFNRRVCIWKVKVPKGRRIKLKIINFNLGVNIAFSRSYFSRLHLFNDFEYLSRITEITANSSMNEPIYTSDNLLTIYGIFSVKNERGFKLEFSSEESTICGSIMFSNNTGQFQLPSSNKSYYCEYDVSAKDNETLTFNIENLIISNRTTSLRSCEFRPAISFKNSFKEKIQTICKNTTSYVFSTTLQDLKMVLIQSLLIKIKELRMTYTRNYCGGVFNVINKLSITQLDLNGSTNCAWQIIPRSENSHLIVYTTVSLGTDCEKEYITINRGITPNKPHLGMRVYCNRMITNSTILGGLYIEYHSKVYNPLSTFNITLSYEESCGGDLTNPFPDIKLRDKYTDNMFCRWNILAPLGYVLEFEFFDRFFIEVSENCTKDYLEFTEVNSTVRYCGREKPPNYISKGSSVMITVRTDNKIHGDGFSLHIKKKCGGILNAENNDKYLHSPNYPYNYDANMNCNYTLIAPNDEMIKVNVLTFDIESFSNCANDNVTVCVGFNEWSNDKYDKCDVYCEKDSLKEIRYRNRITIILKTDGGLQRKGFLMLYSIDSCGGVITSNRIIHSPKKATDGTYVNDMNCFWNITAKKDEKIVIKFELFEMEYSNGCYFDYVEIFSGKDPILEGRLARLCGNLTGELSDISIQQSDAIIHFHSDSTTSYRGFSAYIHFLRKCDEEIQLRINEKYEFTKFSGSYENDLNCNFVFKTNSSYHIQAKFENFHVSECIGGDKFSCDYVQIHDGQGPFAELIGRYTGHDIPPNITSTKSSLYLKFVTDSVITSTGFKISFTVIETICGATELKAEENKPVYLQSPGGNTYFPDVRCQWSVSSDFRTLHMHFEKFDLQDPGKDGMCISDYLEIMAVESSDVIQEGLGSSTIYTGSNSHTVASSMSDGHPKHIYCGTGSPDDYYANSQNLLIKFKSDETIQKSGFKIKVSAVSGCFRNYTSTQGRIIFETSSDCKFEIKAPDNYTISLYYSQVYFSSYKCDTEYIRVIDKKSGKELQKLCNYVDPTKSLFSNSSHIEMEVKLDGLYSKYDITYLASNNGPGCGGNLYNYEGILVSPMYPLNDRGNSDCRWNIRVPNNKRVVLYFDVFDMGSKITCPSDYVEIIEKLDNGQETIVRKFCGEDTPKLYVSEKDTLFIRYRKTVNFDGTGWVIKFSSIKKGGSLPKWLLDNYN